MIQSFADAETAQLFYTSKSRRWSSLAAVARRKLQMLDDAVELVELGSPPGNRLEALKGFGQVSTAFVSTCGIECVLFGKAGRMMSRSLITTDRKTSIPRDPNRRPPPMHPGEILREEFLVPLQLSAHSLALALRVPATRISEIVRERRGITADTAYRLGLYFGTSAEFWMNMQNSYELSVIYHSSMAQMQKEVQPRCALR